MAALEGPSLHLRGCSTPQHFPASVELATGYIIRSILEILKKRCVLPQSEQKAAGHQNPDRYCFK
jgi:hypothetical protein